MSVQKNWIIRNKPKTNIRGGVVYIIEAQNRKNIKFKEAIEYI